MFWMVAGVLAQSSINGTVVDSISGEGLSKATVMLLRGGKTVKFVRTDDKGRFSIDAQPQQGDELQATLMGYGKHRQPVGNENIIYLAQKTFQLKEVKVQGPPVTQRRDTIVYDLTKFASERDNNLQDVLKKLPGVDVEKDGQIKYNGKAISRFTVEGLDLSKGQYNKLTENIRAKDVKKAEVMEHDQPIKALRNRVFTDDIGMNIVLKDSARDQFFVTLRPYFLADNPTHVGGDAVGMQIGKKRQMEYTVQYDRSGRDLGNQFSIFYDAFDFASTAELPNWYSAPSLQSPIDEERLRMNTSQAYSFDYLTKGRNDAENSLSISYNRNVIRQHTQNVSQYFLDGETPTETTEDRQMLLKQDALSMDYNHRINADKHYGNVVFKASANQDDGLTNYTSGTTQRVRTLEINLTAAINQTYTLGRNILQWQSTADYHYSKNKLDLTQTNQTNQPNWSNQSNWSNWSNQSNQSDQSNWTYWSNQPNQANKSDFANNLWHTAHSLSWNRQYGKWHRDYKLRLEAENFNVKSPSLIDDEEHSETSNNVLLQGRLTPSLYYKDDDWRISIAPGATVKRFTHQGSTMLLPSAAIHINRDYGNRANWGLGASYAESTGAWTTLAVSHRRTDYRTWIDAPDFVPRSRMLLSSFEYNYKRAIYQFFSSFRVNYSRNWNNAAMDMVIDDGNYHYTWTRHDTHSDNVGGSASLSKGWGAMHLKTNLSLSGNYSSGQQYSAGESVDYRYVSYALSPEIIFSPSWMEVDYNGSFSFNRSKTGDEWTKTLADWIQRLTLIFSPSFAGEAFDVSLSGVLYHNEMQGSPSVNTLLADAKLTWRLKKVRLSASFRNIFNKKTYEETTYSGIGIFTNRYWLRPRELMVTAQFSL